MTQRDHGGRLSEAIARFGGHPSDWMDLSTGINPNPYPVAPADLPDLTDLPDPALLQEVEALAAAFWNVPQDAEIVATNGASAAIAALPMVLQGQSFSTPDPTYNEFAASFTNHGWTRAQKPDVAVVVSPNNPDGLVWTTGSLPNAKCRVIDESFGDTMPQASLIALAAQPGHVVLKSFGKFWGLAGLRLGFAICAPDLAQRIRDLLGPWPVSGPALAAAKTALNDNTWATQTRDSLSQSAKRLDSLIERDRLTVLGGTSLFRLIDTADAAHVQTTLARHHIWTRIFPYSHRWVRLGLPKDEAAFARLRDSLQDL